MAMKMKQIADSIHGTIFFSELEAELTSTAYFYRLHDVYQSSTVYMTFPTNRTKRYEHSLGTMELASSMLFSSLSNADNKTKDEFFEKMKYYFEKILKLLLFPSGNSQATYLEKCNRSVSAVFDSINLDKDFKTIVDNILKNIGVAINGGYFHDLALDNYQFYPMTVYSSLGDDAEKFFLYRCLLQAIRIVALFHDVGHTPYSHIIETELENLYHKVEQIKDYKSWNYSKVLEFLKILKQYASTVKPDGYECKTIYSSLSTIKGQLHERIGISFLLSAMEDVIPEFLLKIADAEEKTSIKIAQILYYIIVMEFTVAILVEENVFFKSLHKLVDGIIDADRLDYIMRDSLNSSVDWGKIPYKRLINSSKLVWINKSKDGKILKKNEQPFVIAYPMKVSDDIIDLLTLRYKIFVRINFHHQCIKTTMALQSAVRELAENYLKTKAHEECIEEEINILWTALKLTRGERGIRIIQWNDSWLITVLHRALIKLNTSEEKGHRELKENLEEILLNKKRYYSLIKRGSDCKRLVDLVFKYIGLTKDMLETLKINMKRKSHTSMDSNSLSMICSFQELYTTGDLEILDKMLQTNNGEQNSLLDLMEGVLERVKKEKSIEEYKMIVNKARKKTCLPSHKDMFGEIYLYGENKITVLDENRVLRSQIEALEKNSPWIFVYFVPTKIMEDTVKLEQSIIDEMGNEIGKHIKSRFRYLFCNDL